MKHRPAVSALSQAPHSCQRVLSSVEEGEFLWIDADDGVPLRKEEAKAYALAHNILKHLIIEAPLRHKSGHPGGPLSAFTACYWILKRRNPARDQPLRMSAGHLTLLAYGLQWLFGRADNDPRLTSPQAIIENFRTPKGLPGHIEAGIGDIPFGTGPLGKGVSHALGTAFGLQYLRQQGIVDVLLADGDSQEGQVMEAVRLASHLKLDNLIVHGDFNDVQLSDLPSRTVAADFASIVHAAGWHVIEVENGNDPAQVKAALDRADALLGKGKPIFVCYYTTMGYGIDFMEEGSNTGNKNYHGAPLSKEEAERALKTIPPLEKLVEEYAPFRKEETARIAKAPRVATDLELAWAPKKYERTVMEEKGAARKEIGALHIKNLMKVDERIVVLHADLAGSGGFDAVEKEFPQRVINVGVAEANMYMMAAGMRQTGLLPVTYTFAAFGTNEARANARLIDINCGHTRCGILNDCTHTGLSVGEDGETHQELNYMNIPFFHTQVWMPADSNQAGAMVERAFALITEGHQCVYLFSPRSGHAQLQNKDGKLFFGPKYVFDGSADLVRGKGDTTDQVTVIASGICLHNAIAAADALANAEQAISVRVLNIGCLRPIDAAAVMQAAMETKHLIVVEDHNSEGGLASQVADIIADFALPCTLRRLGLSHYFPSATAEDLYLFAGLDPESIENTILDEVRVEVRSSEEAFVTAIYELITNMKHSRFCVQAHPFVEKLRTEQGYMDLLRKTHGVRSSSPTVLPTNEILLKRLEEATFQE